MNVNDERCVCGHVGVDHENGRFKCKACPDETMHIRGTSAEVARADPLKNDTARIAEMLEDYIEESTTRDDSGWEPDPVGYTSPVVE